MIITRTPFRMSFIGGGTDFPDFYRVKSGAVVSTAINKYMYVAVNERFADDIRVSYYSKTEIVERIDEIRHPVVREALKLLGIAKGIEIASLADVRAGTGLGSSSTFTVGLLNALYAYQGILRSAEELAKEACHLEIDIIREPIGKQDQYIAAYGGFRYIQFNPDETVSTDPIILSKENKEELVQNLLLLYTGDVRESSGILGEQKVNTRQGGIMEFLEKLRNMTFELKEQLTHNASPNIMGEFLHNGWMIKKQLASGISNRKIDKYYEKARDVGALGGKILGAGGGGFLLLYCPRERQSKVKESLGLRELEFSFEPEGSKIIHVS